MNITDKSSNTELNREIRILLMDDRVWTAVSSCILPDDSSSDACGSAQFSHCMAAHELWKASTSSWDIPLYRIWVQLKKVLINLGYTFEKGFLSGHASNTLWKETT